jgi:hypothetical protein
VTSRRRAHHLGEPGEAWKHPPAKIEPLNGPPEPPDVRVGERTKTHRAHVAAQDIDELRQFVKAGRAQHPADAGDPFTGHRAEFQDRERPPGPAQAHLAEQDRMAVLGKNAGAMTAIPAKKPGDRRTPRRHRRVVLR